MKAQLGATTREKKDKHPQSMSGLRREWESRLDNGERRAIIGARRDQETTTLDAGAAMDYALAHSFERSSVVPEKELLKTALIHSVGNHSFHYGGEYWILQQAGGNVGPQAQFDFNSNWTRQNNQNSGGVGVGSTFASFLLGLPSGGNLPQNAQSFYTQRFAGLYIQDDWRLTRKLTLNVGLRWDVERPPTERYDRLTDRFDPNAPNPISSSAQAGSIAGVLRSRAFAAGTSRF